MNIVGDLSIVDSVVDHETTPELSGATAVKTLVLGNTTYVYVTSRNDYGIQILKIEDDGSLSPVGTYVDDNATYLGQPYYFDIVTVGSNYFLVVPSASEDGLTTLKVTKTGINQGLLAKADTIQDGTGDLLDYATTVEGFSTANGSYVAVSAYYSDAISIYKVSGTGKLTLVDTATDASNASFLLDGAEALSIHSIGKKTFVYVVASGEDGVAVFEISATGKLDYVTSVAVANAGTLGGVVAGEFNGKNIMIVSDYYDGELNVYSLDADGVPTFLAMFDAGAEIGAYRISKIEIVEIDGVDFVAATSNYSDSISLYSVDPDGTMTAVTTTSDSTLLNGANDIHYVEVGGNRYILVTATDGNRLTVLQVDSADDALVGTMDNDQIIGLEGEDELLGRGGNDMLKGGDGDDVISGHRGNDKLYGDAGEDVLIGGAGNDMLEGGAGRDILIGGYGVDTVAYVKSAEAVNVNLGSGASSGGDAASDVLDSIENITGSSFDDTLAGDASANVIRGGGGNDVMNGGDGNDRLLGGAGHDDATGGAGNDKIILGGGNDTGSGGAGRDTLSGGGGNDTLTGGDDRDTLKGGAGNDRLNGGAGNDNLTGNAGKDVFVFNASSGNDTVTDFVAGADRVDFSGHSDYNSFADVKDDWFQYKGTTIIGSGGNTVELTGVKISELSADDFIF